jgi:signal transduction histidine kinase
MMKLAWDFFTRPRSSHSDNARREHMTRVVLTMMTLVGLGAFILVLIGYCRGDFEKYAVLTITGIGLLILLGWLFIQLGKWQWATIIPPILFLFYGWTSTLQNGIGTNAGLSYGISIVLAALLLDTKLAWVAFAIYLFLDSSTLLFIYHIPWADIGPVIIPRGSFLLGLTLLQSFSVSLLEKALLQAQMAAEEAQQATERLHQEVQQRQILIGELQAKNTELEQFTYTVSHDLKSPLVTIRGFLGLLEKDAEASNTIQVKKDVERITAAADKMQRLLEELLELSRIGRITNPMQEMPLGTIVHEALEMVQSAIETRKVRVVVADDLPKVYVDRVRVVQAIQNLLDNAIKFMGNQTQPLIEVGIVSQVKNSSPQIQQPGPIFFVRDNGIGVAPEHHERIFGLFNRLDTRGEGTGIGLALVKRIIEVHGGKVWIESTGGGSGSTFYFTLGKSQKNKALPFSTEEPK